MRAGVTGEATHAKVSEAAESSLDGYIVKPATTTAWLTQRMVKDVVDAGVFPAGALSVVCGSSAGLMDQLQPFDVVSFTGSADTAAVIRSHPAVTQRSVRVNIEADSLNSALLLPDAGAESLDLLAKEVAREMTVKSGQKCTAIRRAIVPRQHLDAVAEKLKARLAKVVVGDPSVEGVRMGPLASRGQVRDVGAAAAPFSSVHAPHSQEPSASSTAGITTSFHGSLPNFACAIARPRTVPGTPGERHPLSVAAHWMSPFASVYMVGVDLSGAFSRTQLPTLIFDGFVAGTDTGDTKAKEIVELLRKGVKVTINTPDTAIKTTAPVAALVPGATDPVPALLNASAKGFHLGGMQVHTDDAVSLLCQACRGDCADVAESKN